LICLLIALVSVLLAQSNSVARSHPPVALSEAQELPAGVGLQSALAAQKPPVSFAKVVKYDSGYSPTSVAIADLNGDGHPDVVIANYCLDRHCENGGVSVLLGNGDGTFQTPVTYTLGGANWAVVIGDVNGDGYPDLVVCSQGGWLYLLLGNGDGTFRVPMVFQYLTGGNPQAAAIADVNGDGKPDIVVANCNETGSEICEDPGSVGVLLGNGDGTFQPAVNYSSGGDIGYYQQNSITVGDVNGDGRPDVIVANNFPSYQNCDAFGVVSVLLGNGDGTFQEPVVYNSGGFFANSVAIGDVNGDGYPDVVVSNAQSGMRSGTVAVLLNNGDGTFQAPVTYDSGGVDSATIVLGDLNGDGHPDLVVVNQCRNYGSCPFGTVSAFVGNGDGTFQSAVSYGTGGKYVDSISIGDLNGDGKLDLVATNSLGGSVGVLLNSFTAKTATKATSSLNPSQVNQSVTFTAAITSNPPAPNGEMVTFYNGATQIGTGTTADGIASLTTSFSAAGKYTIKARYPGDLYHKASSGMVKQMVNN